MLSGEKAVGKEAKPGALLSTSSTAALTAAAAPDAGAVATPGVGKEGAAPVEKKKGAAPKDGADAKEKPAPSEAESGGAEGGGAATAAVVLHMPEPPTAPSPATVKRIGGVKARAGRTAQAQGALPPASKSVGDAQKAVTPPDAERAAAARAALIAQVNAAPSPEIVALCERIREVIRKKRPPDEDALVKAEPDKAASEAGGQLNSTVPGEAKKVQDNYGAMNTSPAGAQPTAGPPIPPQPEAAPSAPVNAKAATPDAVPPQNVSLDKDAEEARKKTQAAGMDKPAASLVQSGPIAEARAAQGELDQAAKENPAQVLAKQKEALAKADLDMGALQMRALEALNASRDSTVKKTTSRQQGMVGDEEEMRTKAGGEAKTVFDDAQTAVKGLLKDLASNAMNKWEAEKTLLVAAFKADIKIVKDRVDERHSGVGGWFVGVWDAVTGLPDWAVEAYDRAEKNFGDGVINKLTTISAEVNSVIAACDLIIRNARERIAQIFKELPASLQGWAAGEQKKLEGQLDNLQKEVIAERDNFNKDLIERSSQAVDEVRAEISELRKKAGGLVGRIVAAVQRFLDDPIKFIIEGLLELLGIPPAAFWAVVAKIKKVVRDIIDDPVGFANNLLKGIGEGFSKFFDNFGTHLLKGFLGWLLGDLKDVQIPKDLSLKSIITFFLQIMGITWPNIRKILAKKIGEKNVALIEKVYSLISLLIEKGPEGIFEMIKEKLDPQTIVDQVISMAVEFMVTAIAKQVAARLLLLFNPAGAILQAIEAIYRVLKWVFQNAARIFTLIETIVNGLADIIAGNVGGFAAAVEKGLAMLIPPVLGFIADYFSLGDLPKMVAKQIKSFREWILGLIESGFDWLIEKGKALLASLGIGKKEKDKEKEGGTAHEQAVEAVASELSQSDEQQGYDELRKSKEDQAQALSDQHNQSLAEEHVKMTVQFEPASKDQADHDLDFTVIIAPNDSKKKGAAKAAVDEPIAGLHPVVRPTPSKSGEAGESHHVPAKALGSGMAGFLDDIAGGLRKGDWKGDKAAAAAARALSKRATDNRSLAKPPGDGLSAILMSHSSHKGDAGAHSSSSAPFLAKLAKSPAADAILLVKRTTANKVQNVVSYVSVNPQIPGWRAFLADVRARLQDPKFRSDPDAPRSSVSLADQILDEAETEFVDAEESSDEFLQASVIDPINEVLDAGPPQGFRMGRAIVAHAMKESKDGTPAGQSAALADLDTYFETSWQPFRDPIMVEWP